MVKKQRTMEEFKDEINLGENVVKTLKGIYDPEIPVDIYELGLIYDVMINEDNEVKVLMTLTSPNCPDNLGKSMSLILLLRCLR